MNILISGSKGMVGKQLSRVLSSLGHKVISLSRDRNNAPFMDYSRGIIDLNGYGEIDVVIHLAGENIASGRWSQERKKQIYKSRVESASLLAEYFVKNAYKPKLFISASAVGFYGDRGDQALDESSERGSGFLADVCVDWEAALKPLEESGVRTLSCRFGMIITPHGGALKKMMLPFKLGLGGKFGNGRQYISWIALDDVIGGIIHAINSETLHGAVNFVAPNPLTNTDFTKILGRSVHRPAFFNMPAFFVNLIFGEMGKELFLSSQYVIPKKLIESGYQFKRERFDESVLTW